jgi:lipopolysaccharide/colanic/teichoic acid biosynthesis glycosyltransferase
LKPVIHDINDFRACLSRERVRTDRTGRPFCVVLIDPGSGNSKDGGKRSGKGLWERSLATRLIRRMRTLDEAGWYDERRLGVLLPETPEEGARKFAEDFSAEAVSLAPALTWEVVTYCGAPPRESRDVEKPVAASPAPPDELLSRVAAPLPGWKRSLDVAISSLLLLALSPLFFLVGLFIRTVSRGPVFYRHERLGRLGRPFTMWKFRTMRINCDNGVHADYLKTLIRNGQSQAMKKLDEGSDDRLIPLGRVLRKSCVDELPQLINVLLGDMSLVGPRPCLRYEADEFLSWHRQRFDTLPGMTGLWQVSGKNRTTFRQMMEFDIRYGRNHTLRQDLAILLRTPQAVFAQVGDTLKSRLLDRALPRLSQQMARLSFFISLLLSGLLSFALFSFVR